MFGNVFYMCVCLQCWTPELVFKWYAQYHQIINRLRFHILWNCFKFRFIKKNFPPEVKRLLVLLKAVLQINVKNKAWRWNLKTLACLCVLGNKYIIHIPNIYIYKMHMFTCHYLFICFQNSTSLFDSFLCDISYF